MTLRRGAARARPSLTTCPPSCTWRLERAALAVTLILTLVAAGCGGDGDELASPTPPTLAPGSEPASVAICAGEFHTCVITPDQHVACAGLGLDGQLGSLAHRTRRSFERVVGVAQATSLACGSRHTCATTRDGALYCWGEAAREQLGIDEATLGAVRVPDVTDALQVVAGDAFTCVRTRARELYCLGALPEPDTQIAPESQSPADDGEVLANNATLHGVVDIAAGKAHVCALLASGVLRCRGDNRAGQLGLAPTHAEPWTELPLRDIVDVEAGGALTCARGSGEGRVRCFGAGSQGQLGDGMRSAASFMPVEVHEVRDARALTIGATHACAIVGPTLGVMCWGERTEDRLGAPSADGHGPIAVRGLTGVIRIAAGGAHTCGITSDLSVWCWGRAREGQQGVASYEPFRTAHRVGALSELGAGSRVPSEDTRALAAPLAGPVPRAIATGVEHVCALSADGTVWCWGGGTLGQLGHGRSGSSYERGVQVAGLSGVVALSAGTNHTCALLADARVACWGAQDGGFGDGSGDASSLPVAVPAFRGALAVSAGERITCALLAGGVVRCSGAALFTAAERLAARNAGRGLGVQTISGLNRPAAVAVGSGLGCAIVEDGRVSCWGPVPGRVTTEARLVRGVAGGVQIDAGHRTGCVASRGGRVSCWEIPPGSAEPASAELVSGLTFVDRVVVGQGVRCAKPRRGGYVCWGQNRSGETGTGVESAQVRSPTPVSDTAVMDQGQRVSLDCSEGYCCGIHQGGAVSCAGAGPVTHLASADAARHRTPVMIPLRVEDPPPAP